MSLRSYSDVDESKPVVWIGSAKDDLVTFPEEVVRAIGFALYEAQKGNKHPNAKPLHGFGGAGVLEVVEDHDGDTYRAVYTVRLAGRIYVLHAFQKKSRHGISTPRTEIDRVKARLRTAEQQHAAWLTDQKG
jgi:phage-related protein